jgi:hypothetical protein
MGWLPAFERAADYLTLRLLIIGGRRLRTMTCDVLTAGKWI